jgi:hypothetical protein
VVGVTVQDQRDIKDRVAGQTNYAGAEAAALRSTTDVPGLVGRSIKAEITHRGFNLGGVVVSVVTNLWHFYNCFDGNNATGESNAEVDFDVYVYKPGRSRVGQHLYYRHLHGVGLRPRLQRQRLGQLRMQVAETCNAFAQDLEDAEDEASPDQTRSVGRMSYALPVARAPRTIRLASMEDPCNSFMST